MRRNEGDSVETIGNYDLVIVGSDDLEHAWKGGSVNLSYFNRIFKAKRGVTPREFRAMYKKNKVIV